LTKDIKTTFIERTCGREESCCISLEKRRNFCILYCTNSSYKDKDYLILKSIQNKKKNLTLRKTMKLFLVFSFFGLMQYHLSYALECYKCKDAMLNNLTSCKTENCGTGQDQCLLMDYKNSNGVTLYEASCSKSSDCEEEDGKMKLCEKRKIARYLNAAKRTIAIRQFWYNLI